MKAVFSTSPEDLYINHLNIYVRKKRFLWSCQNIIWTPGNCFPLDVPRHAGQDAEIGTGQSLGV